MRGAAFGVAWTLWACSAWAGVESGPSQQILRPPHEDNGDWELYNQVAVPVHETFMKEIVVEQPAEKGAAPQRVKKLQPVTRVKYVFKTVTQAVKLDEGQVTEVGGKSVSLQELRERVRDDALVVVTEEPLPPYYAAVFKPNTLVLRLPRHAAPQPAIGPPPIPAAAPGPAIVPEPATGPAPAPGPAPSPAPGPAPVSPATVPPATVAPATFPPATAPGTATGPARSAPEFPASPAPWIVFVSRSDNNFVKIRQFQETRSKVSVAVRGDRSPAVPVEFIEAETITRDSQTTTVPMAALRFSLAEGSVDAARARERIGTAESTVLISADGKLVDYFWLQNVKPSMLVLRGVRLPGMSSQHGAAMPAVPLITPPAPPVAPAPPAGTQPPAA